MKVNPSVKQYQSPIQSLFKLKVKGNPFGAAEEMPSVDNVSLSLEATTRWVQQTFVDQVEKEIKGDLEGLDPEVKAGLLNQWSPEATAERIFDFTTAFYKEYSLRHEDDSREEINEGFEKLVRGAVSKGYNEAMKILQASGAEKEAIDVAKQTMGILTKKYDQYFSELKEKQGEE